MTNRGYARIRHSEISSRKSFRLAPFHNTFMPKKNRYFFSLRRKKKEVREGGGSRLLSSVIKYDRKILIRVTPIFRILYFGLFSISSSLYSFKLPTILDLLLLFSKMNDPEESRNGLKIRINVKELATIIHEEIKSSSRLDSILRVKRAANDLRHSI